MKKLFSILMSAALVLSFGAFAMADEHPKAEHPKTEHPAKKMATADIDSAIRGHITDMSKTDGMFHAQDSVLNKMWNLSLVKVHTDKLTALDEMNYFACVDFKADDGTLIDVDFYLKNENGQLVVTETTVHKLNGQARYMYQEKDGYWVRVDEKAAEHPKSESKTEHPKKEEHPKN